MSKLRNPLDAKGSMQIKRFVESVLKGILAEAGENDKWAQEEAQRLFLWMISVEMTLLITLLGVKDTRAKKYKNTSDTIAGLQSIMNSMVEAGMVPPDALDKASKMMPSGEIPTSSRSPRKGRAGLAAPTGDIPSVEEVEEMFKVKYKKNPPKKITMKKKLLKDFLLGSPRDRAWRLEWIRREWGLTKREVQEMEDEIQKELRQKRGRKDNPVLGYLKDGKKRNTPLTTRKRRRIPTKDFALSGRRYPIDDRGHAISAKGYATQMFKKGYITKAQRDKVDRKADKFLASHPKRNPKWTRKEFVSYLVNTIGPDTREGGMESTSEDLIRAAYFIQFPREDMDGRNYFSRDEFINFLTTTLIPDLKESGSEGYAEDFSTAVWFMLHPTSKRSPNPKWEIDGAHGIAPTKKAARAAATQAERRMRLHRKNPLSIPDSLNKLKWVRDSEGVLTAFFSPDNPDTNLYILTVKYNRRIGMWTVEVDWEHWKEGGVIGKGVSPTEKSAKYLAIGIVDNAIGPSRKNPKSNSKRKCNPSHCTVKSHKHRKRNPLLQTVSLVGNPPTVMSPPFKQGQKVKVEVAWKWITENGTDELKKHFKNAMKLATRTNKTPQYVKWEILPIGSKNKLDNVTAMVNYGTSDSTLYQAPKGSKKGKHLYEHKWGDEGHGKPFKKGKQLPLLVSHDGKTIIQKLGPGQTAANADGWMSG